MLDRNELHRMFLYDGTDIRRRDGKYQTKDIYAGSPSVGNYRRTQIKKKRYSNHRIIWTMYFGDIPTGMEIDHINGDTLDNRICNLRLVTHLENMNNRKLHKNNKSGTAGVCWNKETNKWSAFAWDNGKQNYLGSFTDKQDAIAARKAAERKTQCQQQ